MRVCLDQLGQNERLEDGATRCVNPQVIRIADPKERTEQAGIEKIDLWALSEEA